MKKRLAIIMAAAMITGVSATTAFAGGPSMEGGPQMGGPQMGGPQVPGGDENGEAPAGGGMQAPQGEAPTDNGQQAPQGEAGLSHSTPWSDPAMASVSKGTPG